MVSFTGCVRDMSTWSEYFSHVRNQFRVTRPRTNLSQCVSCNMLRTPSIIPFVVFGTVCEKTLVATGSFFGAEMYKVDRVIVKSCCMV